MAAVQQASAIERTLSATVFKPGATRENTDVDPRMCKKLVNGITLVGIDA
jgi:hypothetical protein